MPEKSINYKGSRIFYQTEGTGAAVTLIHGFGEDAGIWKYQREFLKLHFRLIIPHLPGSGKSELLSLPPDQASSYIETYADCIKEILDQEQIQQSIIIGHSMGGYIALAFAQHFAERLIGLGLIHSSAFADNEERIKIRRKGIKFIQQYGAQEFLKQSIPNLFAEKFVTENFGQIEELIVSSGNFKDAALVQYYNAMIVRPDRTETLKNNTNPVLFIIGEEDKSVYLQDSLKQCYLPSIAQIDILPGVAHMGMWEQKDQANSTIMNFINYVLDA